MLSKIRLLNRVDRILTALKECCGQVILSNCWVNEGIRTIHVQAEYDGRTYNAWGSDTNEAIALAKALVELSERLHSKQALDKWENIGTGQVANHNSLLAENPILSHFLNTSSGLAAHLSPNKAKENSLDELIERHVITKAMLEGIAPNWDSQNTYIWIGPLGNFVALKRYLVKGHGYLYGTGASSNKANAIKKAQSELSSAIAWSRNTSNIQHLLTNFTANSPSEIQAFHLVNNTEIPIFSSVHRDQHSVSSNTLKSDFWIAKIPLIHAFEKTGLVFYRTFSPVLQPFFFGHLAEGPINELAIDKSRLRIQADYNVVA